MHLVANMQVINFGEILISEIVTQVIGKHCSVLREIHGNVGSYLRIPDAYKNLLVYNKNMPVNNCCKTLQVIDLFVGICAQYDHDYLYRVNEDDSSDLNANQEALKFIFLNVPNLNHIGKVFTLEDMAVALDSESEFVTKIKETSCRKTTIKMIDAVKRKVCHLEKLSVDLFFSNSEFLHVLCSLESVTNLTVYCHYSNATLCYDCILQPDWLRLKSLSVEGSKFNSSQCISTFDVSLFANSLSNLEYLKIGRCHDITWDKESHFSSLKHIKLNVHFPLSNDVEIHNLDWFASFAETIIEIEINKDPIESYCSISPFIKFDPGDVLKMNRFPKLEKMPVMTYLKYDINDVIEFINTCEHVVRFGTVVVIEGSDDKEQLRKYLTENNVDCIFEIFPSKEPLL